MSGTGLGGGGLGAGMRARSGSISHSSPHRHAQQVRAQEPLQTFTSKSGTKFAVQSGGKGPGSGQLVRRAVKRPQVEIAVRDYIGSPGAGLHGAVPAGSHRGAGAGAISILLSPTGRAVQLLNRDEASPSVGSGSSAVGAGEAPHGLGGLESLGSSGAGGTGAGPSLLQAARRGGSRVDLGAMAPPLEHSTEEFSTASLTAAAKAVAATVTQVVEGQVL